MTRTEGCAESVAFYSCFRCSFYYVTQSNIISRRPRIYSVLVKWFLDIYSPLPLGHCASNVFPSRQLSKAISHTSKRFSPIGRRNLKAEIIFFINIIFFTVLVMRWSLLCLNTRRSLHLIAQMYLTAALRVFPVRRLKHQVIPKDKAVGAKTHNIDLPALYLSVSLGSF